MSSFDDRKKGFESKFAHDEKLYLRLMLKETSF